MTFQPPYALHLTPFTYDLLSPLHSTRISKPRTPEPARKLRTSPEPTFPFSFYLKDADLAVLYNVPTKALNQAVKRNERRFPRDFMFGLTKEEKDELVTNCDRFELLKHSSALPRAFTEQGVAMLSSVLNSDRAIQVNIQIMRAFTKLREMLSTHEDLRRKVEAMESKYDRQFKVVFDAIKQLIDIESKPKRKIGFDVKEPRAGYGKKGNKGQTKT